MLRLIGFGIAAAGVVVLFIDLAGSGGTLASLALRDVGTIWASVHRDSLLLLQPAVERYLAPWLWQEVAQPFLLLPAGPVIILFGSLVFLIGIRGRGRG